MEENHYPLERIVLTVGGKTRAESVRNGLKYLESACFIVHDGVRPFVQNKDIDSMLRALETNDGATFYHKVADTVKLVDEKTVTLDRKKLKAVTTPQGFTLKALPFIRNPKLPDEAILDEIMLIENELPIAFLEETHPHTKLTTPEDLALIKNRLEKRKSQALSQAKAIGFSFDFHPFERNRPLVLGELRFRLNGGSRGTVMRTWCTMW